VLPFDVMLPAVGQGALGIECRAADMATLAILRALEDDATRAAVTAERALLAQLRGGCMAPIGALGRVESGTVHLSAAVLGVDGKQRLAAEDSASVVDADALGRRVADSLLAQGASDLISAARAR
jgi:hydroxymethylbilane synthase